MLDGLEVDAGLDPLNDDTDGDDVEDGADNCADQPGAEADGCPRTAERTFTETLPEAENIRSTFEYETTRMGYEPDLAVAIEGVDGTEEQLRLDETDGDTETFTVDLSGYAGSRMVLRGQTQGLTFSVRQTY